jgi:hypothetical protein
MPFDCSPRGSLGRGSIRKLLFHIPSRGGQLVFDRAGKGVFKPTQRARDSANLAMPPFACASGW